MIISSSNIILLMSFCQYIKLKYEYLISFSKNATLTAKLTFFKLNYLIHAVFFIGLKFSLLVNLNDLRSINLFYRSKVL